MLSPTSLLPRGEILLPTTLTKVFEKPSLFSSISKLIFSFSNLPHPKIFKDFFACRIVLAANQQHPGNFQRLSGQQAVFQQATSNSQPATSSNQQQQSAAATSSSNQQPAASTEATSSSNQQRQSTAVVNNSNQQQQPAAASKRNNQHSSYQQHLHEERWHLLVITTVPRRGYPASSWPRINYPVVECNHRTEAHFCFFQLF